jgi:hypothetical protein
LYLLNIKRKKKINENSLLYLFIKGDPIALLDKLGTSGMPGNTCFPWSGELRE